MSQIKDVVKDGAKIKATLYSGYSMCEANITLKYLTTFWLEVKFMPIEVLGIDRLMSVQTITLERPEQELGRAERYNIIVTGEILPADKNVRVITGRRNGLTYSMEIIKDLKGTVVNEEAASLELIKSLDKDIMDGHTRVLDLSKRIQKDVDSGEI